MHEVVLEKPGSKEVLLKFVKAYGFRNIQKVVHRLTKSTKEPFHFVEIMACPGGCLNGGGQIQRSTDPLTKNERKERLKGLNSVHHNGDDVAFLTSPMEHPSLLGLYRYIASQTNTSNGGNLQGLEELVGGNFVTSWLSAKWNSHKLDEDGKKIITAATLKW